MIEKIYNEAKASRFDFRKFACPHDPLSHLFEEWISYYRLKFAIVRLLQPKSILEVGVRYGYSAIAFLQASPSAKYLGIDADRENFGGQPGALEWARQITEPYDAEFLVADTQTMKRFPGGPYDLIHIDGQQDGAGTFHDLRRAISQGRWVLLDGYFWTQENFVNANDFLIKYKDVIRYAVAIPGYAGDLLIRVSDEYLETITTEPSAGAAGSGEIVKFYDNTYYLNDCGGHREFRRSKGRTIDDPRLLALLAMSRLAAGRRALDLGCGRGELSFQLAAAGFDITAIDYSEASIAIAKNCFAAAGQRIPGTVRFLCADVTTFNIGEKFDFIVAADLIEHLSAAELDQLYNSVETHLADDGLFVLHSAPSAWFNEKDYALRRASVEKLGGFMPAEPRTRYELLLHINEQSPARMGRQLRRRFPYVKVWVSNEELPSGNLRRKFTVRKMVACRDIYAVAARTPIDIEKLEAVLTPTVLRDDEFHNISISIKEWPRELPTGKMANVSVDLINGSAQTLLSLGPHPIRLSYHWFAVEKDRTIVFEGIRTSIPFGILPGETGRIDVQLQAPKIRGLFLLNLTMVQEGCFWFETKPGFAPPEIPIRIV